MKETLSKMQLVLPRRLIHEVLYLAHDYFYSSHLGFDKTYAKIEKDISGLKCLPIYRIMYGLV